MGNGNLLELSSVRIQLSKVNCTIVFTGTNERKERKKHPIKYENIIQHGTFKLGIELPLEKHLYLSVCLVLSVPR